MANRGVEANTITCSAAISAYEKAGEWVRALQFLEGMANSRVEANTITYNAGVSACEKAGEWARALQLLDGMANSLVEAKHHHLQRRRQRVREGCPEHKLLECLWVDGGFVHFGEDW